MATTDNNSVIVELYDLSITERKDDRFGRVVTTKSLTEDYKLSITTQFSNSVQTLKDSRTYLFDYLLNV
ncbi:MAG: hypothetical protein Q8909_16925 [Bacteroidota bacterium]|nr:hypothetical protein [Bacteroidota bacterium]